MPTQKKRWMEFLSLGTEGVADEVTRHRIRFVNFNSAGFLVGSLCALLFLGRSGSPFNDLATLAAMLLNAMILGLGLSGQFRAARFLFVGGNQAVLFLSMAANPRELNLQFFYIQQIVYPDVLYGRAEKFWARIFLASAVGCFLLFSFFPPPWVELPPQPPEVMQWASRLMLVLSTLYLVVAVRFLVATRDTHERDDSEHRARLSMNARLAALGEMAGGMAHEINNPLAIIRGRADQLLRSLASSNTEDVGEGAKVIVKHSDRIATIVRGLRSFARDGHSDPFVETSVRSMVQETISLCQARFTHRSIRLDVVEIPDTLKLKCRPVQIEQVLLNLLNNAFDAVDSAPEKRVEISWEDSGETIRICVSDSGPGVDPENVDKIMQPFFTTKPAGLGTGLGLSISSGIAREHGGDLFLENRAYPTRFVLVLPKRAVVAISRSR